MSNELDLQAKLRKSVKRDGGYAIKLTNRFTIGVPDLLIALPPFVPILAEVKDLGAVVDKFDRQLDVTPKQRNELNGIGDPYKEVGRTSIVLVGLVYKGQHCLVGLPPQAERLSYHSMASELCVAARQVGGYYAINDILLGLEVAKAAPW